VKKALEPSEKQIQAEAIAFRWLCRLGPFFGGMTLGSVTLYIDWFLPPPGMHRGTWTADYPYLFAVAFSVVIGAVLGGAMAESAESEVAGQFETAADACLRWGLATVALLVLVPFLDFDSAVRDVVGAYAAMLRGYGPALFTALLLLVRGTVLARRADAP
jgi:hypothetical protein